MIRKPINKYLRVALGVACFLSLLVIYGLLAWRWDVPAVPTLDRFPAGWKKLAAGDTSVWMDFYVTYRRMFLGMLAGAALSFVVGMAMGCFTFVESFFMPAVAVLARIPPTAMMPIYFVIFSATSERPFIAMIAFGVFPTLTQSIFQAVKNDVNEHLIFKSYTLGATHLEVIWEVVYKQILPRILQAIQLHFGPAMVFLMAANLAFGDEGIGPSFRAFKRGNDWSNIYTYLLLLGLTGLLVDWTLTFARRKICPWFGE